MKICIVGGGMAGIICAIVASTNSDNSITIIERQSSIGKKIAITGNGKCNLSNKNVTVATKYSSYDRDILERLMASFDDAKCKAFYESIGLYTSYTRDGLYPLCGQASAVVDILEARLNELGVRILTDTYADEVKPTGDGYKVCGEYYDAVVLAFGGKAGVYGENSSCGIEIIKGLGFQGMRPSPALTGIICKGDYKSIAGVRTHARTSLYDGDNCLYKDDGELQLTEYGLSGIPVFNITNHLPYNMGPQNNIRLVVDFAPDFNEKNLKEILVRNSKDFSSRTILNMMVGMMNNKLAMYLLNQSQIKCDKKLKDIDPSDIDKLVSQIKAHEFVFDSLRNYKNAQVMHGGVRLTEIDDNYQANNYKNVFLIGEMLDISGECGGYNLYFAYHSGRVVGEYLT